MTITVAQIRAARGLLGWSQVRLADAAGLSEPTVKRLEGGKTAVSGEARASIRAALEAAGVVFLGEGETTSGGAGVRMRYNG